jgi:hypothetical protein
VNDHFPAKRKITIIEASLCASELNMTSVSGEYSYWCSLLSGMSGLAPTSVLRGITMILSSGPQLAPGGNWPMVSEVTSFPIMAKSPVSSSKISGHPLSPADCAPFKCGFGPNLRKNMLHYLFRPTHCQWSVSEELVKSVRYLGQYIQSKPAHGFDCGTREISAFGFKLTSGRQALQSYVRHARQARPSPAIASACPAD